MKRIFFVEDDLSLINGMTYALKKEGYEVETARTAAEAETLWAEGKYLEELLSVLNLKERRNHLPSQLSGGQQGAAIGHALITRPSLILADETTGRLC